MRFVKTAESIFGIPSNFTRVEYLQSTGNQYIDTGVIAKTGLTVEAKIKYVSHTGIFCGAITTSAGNGDRYYAINFSQQGKVAFTYLDTAFTGSTNLTAGNIYTIKTVIGFTRQEIFVDGVSTGYTTKMDNVDLHWTLGLFALHRGGSFTPEWYSESKAILYYCKIWDGDTLVRDFIPCIDSLGRPCMYDLVGKKAYYNQGTGEFTVGRQIIPVEYLQSTGTQYIDTMIKSSANMFVKTKFNSSNVSSKAVFGSYSGSSSNGVGVFFGTAGGNISGKVYCNNTNIAVSPELVLSANTTYEIEMSGTILILNNSEYTAATTADNNYNMLLFARSNNGTVERQISGKIYYFTIKDNGTLVADFIPCKDENNVGFMFDTLSGTVYENAGTGAFVVGNNKYKTKLRLIRDNILPTGYTQIEYLQSSGQGAYIKTGITANFNSKAEVIFSCNELVGSPAILGGRTSGSIDAFCVWGKSNAGYVCCNFSNTGVFNSDVTAEANTKYLAVLDSSGYTVNGSKTAITTTTTFTSPELYLFDANGANTSTSGTGNRKLVGKIYYCKIWDGTTLVRSFVPAIDPSGTPCMYDLVSRTPFYNEGTGTFTTGKPVLPIVRFPVDPVPVGYKTVNYLQSTGTQYIDTGVSPSGNTSFVLCSTQDGFDYTSGTTRFGSKETGSTGQLAILSTTESKFRFDYGGGGASQTQWLGAQKKASNFKLDASTHTFTINYVDGTAGSHTFDSTASTFTSTYPLLIFGYSTGSTKYYASSMKVTYCKIWDSNTLVRNFIPVVRLLDNKAGMWDTVTKQFYTTPVGDFITG